MKSTPKTIQIFLPSGDPRGIRIAEITTRIVQVIEVPRSLLQAFIKMPESRQVALYVLVGDEGNGTEPNVYVGQSGDLRMRLVNHNQRKDFWQRALVLISLTNSLTQTHATFLEWHCLQAVRTAGRYRDQNGNSGNKPHTPPPLEADCLEIFETGSALLATLGYPLFDPVGVAGALPAEEEVFTCTSAGISGRGLYTPEGFVVLKGSVGRKANVPSIVGTSDERFRERLIDAGVMRVANDTVVFERDHLFGSPSMALIALLGRTANGWKEWKGKGGETLDKLKRKAIKAEP